LGMMKSDAQRDRVLHAVNETPTHFQCPEHICAMCGEKRSQLHELSNKPM
jgi:hypothetical protein